MGKSKDEAHTTLQRGTFIHHVVCQFNYFCIRNPALSWLGVSFSFRDATTARAVPTDPSPLLLRQRELPLYTEAYHMSMSTRPEPWGSDAVDIPPGTSSFRVVWELRKLTH